MVMRIIKISAAPGGGSARPLAGRSFCKSTAWVLGASLALFASIVPASAQLQNIGTDVAVPGTAITANTTLSGTLDGGGHQGYFVATGATLTVNSSTFQNFTTSGGAGTWKCTVTTLPAVSPDIGCSGCQSCPSTTRSK